MADTEEKSAPQSRLETNFLRVFQTTQEMAGGIRTKDWTYDKQVEWLEKTLPEMEKSPCAPSHDSINSYRRQLLLLRAAVEADTQSHTSDDAPIVLAGGISTAAQNKSTVVGGATAGATVVGGAKASGTVVGGVMTQQIKQRTKTSVTARLRRQLMSDGGEGEARAAISAGYEELLATDERKRERLLDNMLSMTHQLKEQSQVVGRIAKKDVQTLSASCGVADSNQERLQTESDRLTAFNKRACNCWIWLVLLLVCAAFISMVLFIKLFPKRLPAAS